MTAPTVESPAHAVLPPAGFVRLSQFIHLVPVSHATWWRMVAAGRAPKPLKLSAGVTAWRVDDIRAYLDQRADQVTS